MDLGMAGVGRMGGQMTRRLLLKGHRVIAHDQDVTQMTAMTELGALAAPTLAELVGLLKPPRITWLMLPAGAPTDSTIKQLADHLSPGDLIVDGANSFYKDSVRHAQELAARGIRFADVGVSGGVWGGEAGYCLMVGGDPDTVRMLEPLLADLAAEEGLLHVGPSGMGHFVKMVHNGIEYGLLQAYAEGFALLRSAPAPMDARAIARLWNHGSVVRSWLLELAERALEHDPDLSQLKGYVHDSGEGRWIVQEAVELGIPIPVIAHSLFARFRSRMDEAFSDQFIAALRHQFGGHAVRRAADRTPRQPDEVPTP